MSVDVTTDLADLLPPSTRTECDHCGRGGGDFAYAGHCFCCECMLSLCSWILEGGMVEEPDMFDYLRPVEPEGTKSYS